MFLSFVHLFIHPFLNIYLFIYLFSTYCVPGTGVSTEQNRDTALNKTKFLLSWSLWGVR